MPAINRMTRSEKFDFWGTPRVGHPASIMVAPEDVELLRNTLERLHLAPKTFISDVGPYVLLISLKLRFWDLYFQCLY
jgi:hypothetical protein